MNHYILENLISITQIDPSENYTMIYHESLIKILDSLTRASHKMNEKSSKSDAY